MKTILLLLIFNHSLAQSLIKNGSFENYDSIPTADGQLPLAKGWQDIQSADYFHTLSPPNVNIPNSFLGIIPAASEGMAYAGIVSYMKGYENYREYLIQKLKLPLVQGKFYTVSLKAITVIPNPLYGGLVADHFGVLFSTVKPQANNGWVQQVPQCVYAGQLYCSQWKQLTFQLYADSAYKYISIGCFVNDSVQQRLLVNTPLLFECVYTLIDDVQMHEGSVAGIEENVLGTRKKELIYDIIGRRVR